MRVAPIIALVTGDRLRARVAGALPAGFELVFCERSAELRERVAAQGAAAIITQLVDSAGTDVRPVIGLLLGRLPGMTVIVVEHRPSPPPKELIELGRLGVSCFLERSARDFAESLRAALARVQEQSPAAAILRHVQRLVPPELQPFFAYCARAASRPLLAEEAARHVGQTPRTLRDRLGRAGLPSPQRVVRWSRVLHAAWRLDLGGGPLKRIIEPLGYETDTALRKQVARLTGLPIGAVVARGGFRYLLDQFERELRAGGTRRGR